ncbi:MAG: hypothetical protein V1936_03365 [Patescibacteria group bacterium]
MMFLGEKSLSASDAKLAKLHTNITRRTNFFPGQRANEEVEICIRTHWLQRAKIFLWFLLLGVFLPGIIFIFFVYINLPLASQLILNLIAVFYFLFAWLVTLIEFIKSEFTVVVVTNERVVDITQTSIFDWQIAETNLDRIQEVGGQTHGFWRTLSDIGQLEIQTAGSDIPLLMNFVKSPQMTARKILDIQKASHQRRRMSDFSKRDDDLVHARKGEKFSAEELKAMRDQPRPIRKTEDSL